MATLSTSSRDYASDASLSSVSNNRLALDTDSDDPDFDNDHVQTSTPLRPTRKTSGAKAYRDEDPLHASDTESLDLNDDDIERGLRARHQALTDNGDRLTRRSLLELSGNGTAPQPFPSSSGVKDRALYGGAHGRIARGDTFAPSPSTGSSTLVERDEDGLQRFEEKRRGGNGDDEVTVRHTHAELSRQPPLMEEEEREDDQGPVSPLAAGVSEEGSSSSPRPRRNRIGNLASYVDARMSSAVAQSATPRRSTTTRRQHPPVTPAAPGAYPSSARKPAAATAHLSSSHPPPSSPRSQARRSPSSQIHDAFTRLITGPDGALAHAAERRSAVRAEPPTPHPTGHYAFFPSSSLPVERGRKGKGRGEEVVVPVQHIEPRHPTKLERALRQLSQAQREASARENSVDLDEYLRASSKRAEGGDIVAEEREERLSSSEDDVAAQAQAQRSALEFAMARSFAEQEEEREEEREEEQPRDRVLEDASAEESFSDDQDLRLSARRRAEFRSSTSHQQQSVRFASPPSFTHSHSRFHTRQLSSSRSRSPSPPPATVRPVSAPPPRSQRSATPPLPPLPLPFLPESPEPSRLRPATQQVRQSGFLRRSHSFDAARLDAAPSSSAPSIAAKERLPSIAEPPASTSPTKSPRRSTPSSSSRVNPTPKSPPRTAQLPPSSTGTSPSTVPTRRSPPRPSPPSRLATSINSEPPATAEEGGAAEADLTLPLLVSQLSSAVRALAAASSTTSTSASTSSSVPATGLNRHGLPLPSRGSSGHGLGRELERRRKESDRRRREMESELGEMEKLGSGEGVRLFAFFPSLLELTLGEGELQVRRAEMLEQLAETYVAEQELGFQVDELRKSIEEMGQFVGDQVRSYFRFPPCFDSWLTSISL